MLSYSDALDHLLRAVSPLASESVSLVEAVGRTLAVDLIGPYPMPPYSQSLMDGYAVRSEDTLLATEVEPVRLTLGLTLTAGQTVSHRLTVGEAVRIMTGALIPDGANAVVRLEDGEVEGTGLVIRQPLSPGQYIQPRGAEVPPQSVICRAGEVLTPQRIGMALALGLASADVVGIPRVAWVAPGDELLTPGAPLELGKKWCSNLYALELRAREIGVSNLNLGIVPDTLEALTQALQQGLGHEILVILGASGQGDHDFATRAMAAVGATPLFRGLAMAPGRGTTVARQGSTLIFGLPGSPWAALVTFDGLVVPVLRALLGQSPIPLSSAILTDDIRVGSEMTHFIPVRLYTQDVGLNAVELLATPLRDLMAVAQAETDWRGWIQVPPHQEGFSKGTRVRIHLTT